LCIFTTSGNSQTPQQQRSGEKFEVLVRPSEKSSKLKFADILAFAKPLSTDHSVAVKQQASAFEIEPEFEMELKLENWMISQKNFETNRELLSRDCDKFLEIEAWMTDTILWQ
jgi:hypothetical protein